VRPVLLLLPLGLAGCAGPPKAERTAEVRLCDQLPELAAGLAGLRQLMGDAVVVLVTDPGDDRVAEAVRRSLGARATVHAAPVFEAALIGHVRPAAVPVYGLPAERLAALGRFVAHGSLDALRAGAEGIALGDELATHLGVGVGDRVLVAPTVDPSQPDRPAPAPVRLPVVALIRFPAGHLTGGNGQVAVVAGERAAAIAGAAIGSPSLLIYLRRADDEAALAPLAATLTRDHAARLVPFDELNRGLLTTIALVRSSCAR
jgi:ABC-type lipoprotein release transport system permease subunit